MSVEASKFFDAVRNNQYDWIKQNFEGYKRVANTEQDGKTPLELAIDLCHFKIVRLLARKGVELRYNTLRKDQSIPRTIAIKKASGLCENADEYSNMAVFLLAEEFYKRYQSFLPENSITRVSWHLQPKEKNQLFDTAFKADHVRLYKILVTHGVSHKPVKQYPPKISKYALSLILPSQKYLSENVL